MALHFKVVNYNCLVFQNELDGKRMKITNIFPPIFSIKIKYIFLKICSQKYNGEIYIAFEGSEGVLKWCCWIGGEGWIWIFYEEFWEKESRGDGEGSPRQPKINQWTPRTSTQETVFPLSILPYILVFHRNKKI
jgi:hypothetical protein